LIFFFLSFFFEYQKLGLCTVRRQRDIGFEGGVETLRKLLKQIGFAYKRKDGTRYLRQKPAIAIQRLAFLSSYLSYLQEGTHDFVFLDETWVFRKGSGKEGFAWQNSDVRSCPTKLASYGERYVVMDAGSKNGFIPGAHKAFSTKKKPKPGDDYHGDLDGPLFLNWFQTKLLPNLKQDSVIVMDNAPYHRVQVHTMEELTRTGNRMLSDVNEGQ